VGYRLIEEPTPRVGAAAAKGAAAHRIDNQQSVPVQRQAERYLTAKFLRRKLGQFGR
jgi:hypothetical protein